MEYDVWFSRTGDDLYFTLAEVDCEPTVPPRRVVDVGTALRKIRDKGLTISQVGILPPEMIGLYIED